MNVLGLRLLAGVCIALSTGVLLNVLVLQGYGSRTSRALLGKPLGMAQLPVGAERNQPATARRQGKLDQPLPLAQPSRQLVRAIQRELGLRGYYPHAPSGRQGVLTRAAIMAFERDHGLSLSAHASERVLRSILLGANLAGGERADAVGPEAQALIRLVQHLLARTGGGKIATTGVLDSATKRAIMAFERRSGRQPSGKISADLIARLQREAKKS